MKEKGGWGQEEKEVERRGRGGQAGGGQGKEDGLGRRRREG